MQSNYKRLGDYIQEVNIRNKDLKQYPLLGVSIKKEMIISIANTVGTDMSTYKIIKKNQFAYGPVTSRNGDKISIALSNEEQALLSQAYVVFETNNPLLPEYLMMWFRRPEFDRYARYKSHGSAREIFDWQEMSEVMLPIPSVEKQQEIVNEYHTIQNRINLNNQLIAKLEETAQTIYKQWFVDFEFPFDFAQGKPSENGKPYKSNGGKMVWCEELEKEIPEGWEVEQLGNIIESFSKSHSFKKDKLIFFNTSDILNGEFLHSNYMEVCEMPGQAKKQIRKGDILFSEIRPNNKRFAIVRVDADDYVVSTKLMVLRKKNDKFSVYRLYQFLTEDSFINVLQQSAEGRSGTFPQITFEEDLEQKPFLIADRRIEKIWKKLLDSTFDLIYSKKDENQKLKELKELLLGRMVRIEN